MPIVKRENFKRHGYRLSSKPYFMSQKAFIQANLALNSLNAKLLFTEKERAVAVSPAEVNAVILMGINYAGKESELRPIRDFLTAKTKAEGKAALYYLPGKGGVSEVLKKLGYEGELSDEKLFEVALTELKGKEKEFIPKIVSPVEEMFITSVVATLSSPYSEGEVSYFTKQIKAYVESVKKRKGGDLTREELAELYNEAEKAVSYRIQKKVELMREVLQGKSILEVVTPKDFTDEIGVYRGREALFSVVESILQTYDPDFKRDRDVYRALSEEIKNTFKRESPESIAEFLKNTLTEVENYPETPQLLAYNVLALSGYGRSYSISPLNVEAFLEKWEELEAESGVDLFVKELAELGKEHPYVASLIGEKALKVAQNLMEGDYEVTEEEIERLEELVSELRSRAKEVEKEKERETFKKEVITENDLADIDI